MTIDPKDYGWPINVPGPLLRSPKCNDVSALLSSSPVTTGWDLAQMIVWALEDRGIVLSEKRVQMITEACLKPEEE